MSNAPKLKAWEDENVKLKKLLAETMMNNAVLKDVASKKCWRPMWSGTLWRMFADNMG